MDAASGLPGSVEAQTQETSLRTVHASREGVEGVAPAVLMTRASIARVRHHTDLLSYTTTSC